MPAMGKVADPPHTKRVLKDFGVRLRKWRDGNGFSRPRMAELLGMTDHGRLATYERGDSSMPYHYLLKLVEVSNRPLDYWLTGREPEPHEWRPPRRG